MNNEGSGVQSQNLYRRLFFDRTWSKFYIKLVGENGESKRTRLPGTVTKESTYTVRCSKSIGKLGLIELEKMKTLLLPEVCWFVDKVKVTSPEKDTYTFPIYHCINDEEIHRFREGAALLVAHDHSLIGKYTREMELQNGNIFLCDYKILDGVQTNIIHHKNQYLMAPLVLLHQTPEGQLKPVAIQLKQRPDRDNPIFFPTDSEYDWLLAKTFVRSAYFNEHELNIHLLRTHLLAEVFALSLFRNLPMVHPLYKYTSSGGEGMMTILLRSMSSLTYRSLCLPDDIIDRGVESLPHYYYRDDGLKLWDIIHRFVDGVLSFYYRDDGEVERDPEVQNWIQDIFEHGFLSNESSGVPQHLSTLPELVKFVTMVIFTCSAQHAAVSNGQFDYGAWMPNTPSTLQLPPPTKKDTVTEKTILNTLPNISTTVHAMAVLNLLSKQSSDFVALGQYPNEYFNEETPLSLIKVFQKELGDLHEEITKRNKDQALPYTYLDPKLIENSVSL